MNAKSISISRSGRALAGRLTAAVRGASGTIGRKHVGLSILVVLTGVMLGVGLFTAFYAKGASYLGNDPATCANCHVMRDNYNGWLKSSHGKVATCNDCHTPHGLVPKYLTKANNGMHHSIAFTTQNFPDEIRIKDRSLKVTEGACLKCHKEMVSRIEMTRPDGQKVSCVQCHRTVGHM